MHAPTFAIRLYPTTVRLVFLVGEVACHPSTGSTGVHGPTGAAAQAVNVDLALLLGLERLCPLAPTFCLQLPEYYGLSLQQDVCGSLLG